MFELQPLGAAVASHVGGGTPSRHVEGYWGGEIPWASVKDFAEGGGRIASTQECITSSGLRASASNLIAAGTPLVCTRMAVGRSAIATVPLAINQDVKALAPTRGTSPGYLLKLLEYIQPRAEGAAVGSTVKGIRIQDYLSLPVTLAPMDEQPLIAQILDTLDTTIRQTEAIIEKLKQVKLGLLHDLLTRGIDANGELRPPQSEALNLYVAHEGQLVPRAWPYELLDEVAERGSGHTPSKSVASYWNGGVKWVSLADSQRLDQIYIGETDKEISDAGIANSSAVKHPAGTVILSRDAGVGKSAVLADEMAVSQHFMAWKCSPRLNNLYLYFMLQRMKSRFEAIALGSTVKTIGLDFFRKLRMPVPPRQEQDRTVDVLLAAETRVGREQQELEKLKMLKSGLMDDLLTGHVRVTPLVSSMVSTSVTTK
jgi:type I restriction enzyme S subunit